MEISTANAVQESVAQAPVNPAPAREKWTPYLVMGPALLVTGLVLIPFAMSVYYSLTNYRLTRAEIDFVGLRNYVDVLTDSAFWKSTRVTFIFALSAVGIETLLGTLVAFLLNTEAILAKVCRPLLLLPMMISPLISTLLWRLMMSPEFGVLNYFLSFFGHRRFPWHTAADTAMFTVVLVDVWTYTPFIALLVLAGLRSLPREPFEAARVDGASHWFRFRKVTLPLLSPYIIIAVVFRLIDSLRQFDIIYGMTRGGPGDTLMNFQVFGYTTTFNYHKPAQGLTYIIINWLIIYLISYFLLKYWRMLQARAS